MVMVWNENSSHLECAFAKHYEEPITVELSVPLFKGITGHAAGTRISARVDDVRLDQRYIEFPIATTYVLNWLFRFCFRTGS